MTEVVRIDHLYALIALSATAIAVSLSIVPPHDLWWHMRIGQLVLEQGTIPLTTLFAWSIPADTPEVYGSWLGGVLLYLFHAAGGPSLVIFVRNLLAVTTFALVGMEVQRRTGSWKLASLAVALAGLMGINNVVVRPQIWAWVPFALTLLVLGRYRDRALRPGWLAVLPLIMVFWVNAHGSFLLEVALVAAFVVGETLEHLLVGQMARTWPSSSVARGLVPLPSLVAAGAAGAAPTAAAGDKPPALRNGGPDAMVISRTSDLLGRREALGKRELAYLYGAAAATGLAILVNPHGVGILGNVRDLMADPAGQRIIVEWQPPAPTDAPNVAFFGSILLLLAVFASGRSRPGATDLVLLCGFLWLAWNGMRYVFWYGLLATPLLAYCLSRGPRPSSSFPHQSPAANNFIAACLILPVILAQPWLVRLAPLPDAYFDRMLPAPTPPLLDTATPVAAVEYLRANPGGKLFNEMGYGSYVIWALPEQPVFIDSRVYPYSIRHWEDYLEITQGRRAIELLEQYGADRVLLSLKVQPRLSEALAQAPSWQKEYADQWSEVWRRR